LLLPPKKRYSGNYDFSYERRYYTAVYLKEKKWTNIFKNKVCLRHKWAIVSIFKAVSNWEFRLAVFIHMFYMKFIIILQVHTCVVTIWLL
jgi:hypothetical protein